MVCRAFLVAGLLLYLSGCKTSNKDLAARSASAALNDGLFAAPTGTQTLTFTEGGAQPPKPLALDTFLYAKRWLTCKNTEPGPVNSETVCTFEVVGRTYAPENEWKSAPDTKGCAHCETWTVPLAHARLESVKDVTRVDKNHAAASYVFGVIPNEFGAQLGIWMGEHPSAWCGPDPRAVGSWSRTRTGDADFERTNGTWHITTAANTFVAAFADLANGTAAERPCPG